MDRQIRAGCVSEVSKESGDWLIVDIGFAESKKSCGVLKNDDRPEEVTFNAMVDCVVKEARRVSGRPLNLMLEAPLSSAFNKDGNPTGRSCEQKKGWSPRYWYLQSATLTIVATGHLLRALVECRVQREVRLFEGFASFKNKDAESSHASDVKKLREVVWNRNMQSIIAPDDLKRDATDRLESTYRFANMDFKIPPVVVLEA